MWCAVRCRAATPCALPAPAAPTQTNNALAWPALLLHTARRANAQMRYASARQPRNPTATTPCQYHSSRRVLSPPVLPPNPPDACAVPHSLSRPQARVPSPPIPHPEPQRSCAWPHTLRRRGPTATVHTSRDGHSPSGTPGQQADPHTRQRRAHNHQQRAHKPAAGKGKLTLTPRSWPLRPLVSWHTW